MIVLSLALVIAAAVALFIGLFVATTGLTFIYVAIGLCLVSLLLLWFGTRSRRTAAPTAPSPPVYGGARAAGTAAPARRATVSGDEDQADGEAEAEDADQLDALTDPDVVRATSARDRAAARVAEAASETQAGSPAGDDEPSVQVVDTPATAGTAKKSTAKKSAKKSTAKKSTAKKSAAKKSAAKKSTAKKSTAKKSTAKKSTAGTRGTAARERLAGIPGVGPAKQEALLQHYGSLEAIRDASVDDIVANVKGFGRALASRVKDAL